MKTTQFGRMTLFEVVEWADDLANIRVACMRAFWPVKDFDTSEQSSSPMVKRLHKIKGSKLSLAKCAKLMDRWKAWTWKDGATLSTVQGFLTDSHIAAMLD